MSLDQEIKARRAEIHSDGYPMSIGELINLCRDDELDLHPAFQRFYRWSAEQKSRLIESMFLGIPIPSIFVSQREDGVWDVIDGLQRLSTILELVGELRKEDGRKLPPLVLKKTRYLPSLEGKKWEDEDPDLAIGSANQLIIRRSKIDVKIILQIGVGQHRQGDVPVPAIPAAHLVLVKAHPRLRGGRLCPLASSKHSSMAHLVPATLTSSPRLVSAGPKHT